ncbi:acetyltransferase (GNAT) family protein [Hydrogenispora ethanolica]|uniref:Acetyltransferase (GNAT) family protein n=1 Tax=Hydrogenispora ethanolica TaxID=1082276 RepID=A0A4R1RGU4_HYDET|nr:GNAT family N-acetyltransferase [Hydrogenispora ethanolica]TCL65255.1 acetyltransferase (GNAT) family protein [Hydrogenispora ethanolica]
MIRNARSGDLAAIMEIVRKAGQEMRAENRVQWDENYPRLEDFARDVAEETLYVEEEAGRIRGFLCLNYQEPDEYRNLQWSLAEPALVLHRMAVDSAFRNRGIASALMRFGEALARNAGVRYLKSDTYSLNPQMNALFIKLDYRFVGAIQAFGRPNVFHCYEKVLIPE